MAEVRHLFGKGAYDFAHKIYSRHLLDSLNKRGKSAIQASPLSAGLLSGNIKNGGLHGAENDADKVTVGDSPDSYTRLTPGELAAVNYIWGKGDVGEDHDYRGLKEYSLSNKAQVQIVERNVPRCRSNARFRRTLCASGPYSRRLCWGRGQFVFIRDYSGNGARTEPLYKTKTGYYEILEVSPAATQAQIKTAYYKQSFVYHPDRNAGSDEATVRFSEISEAYTVLGNKALRKKYDRGLLSQSDLISTARAAAKDGTGGSAKKQTESRRPVVSADARGGVSDFDKFFKSHYSEQLQRQRDLRVRKEEMLKKKQQEIYEQDLGRMTEVCVGVLLAIAVALIVSLKRG